MAIYEELKMPEYLVNLLGCTIENSEDSGSKRMQVLSTAEVIVFILFIERDRMKIT